MAIRCGLELKHPKMYLFYVRRCLTVENKPITYRAKNTFYSGGTRCSSEACDKKCTFPLCCRTRESFPSKSAADSHEQKLKILKEKVELL